MDSFLLHLLGLERPQDAAGRQQRLWQQQLAEQALAFVQLCDSTEARMRRIVEELQDAAAAVQQLQRRMLLHGLLVLLCLLVGLWVTATVRAKVTFNTDVTLVLVGAVLLVLFVVAVSFITLKTEEQGHLRRMRSLAGEFRSTAEPLRNLLENLKVPCGGLRRAWRGERALKFIRLEINILELFFLTETLQVLPAQRSVAEEAREFSRAAQDFVRMKRDLQTFYSCPGR